MIFFWTYYGSHLCLKVAITLLTMMNYETYVVLYRA